VHLTTQALVVLALGEKLVVVVVVLIFFLQLHQNELEGPKWLHGWAPQGLPKFVAGGPRPM